MQPSGLERGTALGHDEVAVFENIVGLNPGRAKPLKIITRAFTCNRFYAITSTSVSLMFDLDKLYLLCKRQ